MNTEMRLQYTDDGEKPNPGFYSASTTLLKSDRMNIKEILEDAAELLQIRIDSYIRNGSGWILDKITELFVNTDAFNPLHGSSYIPLNSIYEYEILC